MQSADPLYRRRAMRVTDASRFGPKISADEAAELERARERMLARHKLIEGMIRNNEMQLKNQSALGGAEIELECAKRDAARAGAADAELRELERATERFKALQDNHARLVAEREWLNASLLQFDAGASAEEHQRSGHA
jgi:hypothetical protein